MFDTDAFFAILENDPHFHSAEHSIYEWSGDYIEMHKTADGTFKNLPEEGTTPVNVPSFYPILDSSDPNYAAILEEFKQKLIQNMEIITKKYILSFVPDNRQVNFTNAKQNIKFVLENQTLLDQAIADGLITDKADTVIANLKDILNKILAVEKWIADIMAVHYSIVSNIMSATDLQVIANEYRRFPADYEAVPKPAHLTTFTSRNLGYAENIYMILASYL